MHSIDQYTSLGCAVEKCDLFIGFPGQSREELTSPKEFVEVFPTDRLCRQKSGLYPR